VPSGTTQYNPPTAVAEVTRLESNITLFPIPVVSDLTIQLKENKNYTVVVYDIKGSILENKKITTTTKIDMSGQAYGVYFVEVSDMENNEGFVKRIVKQ
jgi:hypothetical protein